MPDLSNWLNDDQVCARLGISNRTLDREVSAGHIPSEKRPRPGARPERVFDPAMIEARVKPSRPTVMPSSVPAISPPMAQTAQALNGGANPLSMLPPGAEQLILARLMEMVAASQQPPKPWATLREAARDTGLSWKFLRRLIAKGRLDAIKDVSIKVHRASLEDLDVSSELVQPLKARKGKR